jgi:hypothetical protein
MDQGKERQLYTVWNGRVHSTDREVAVARIEDTDTRYQQHMTLTTGLVVGDGVTSERDVAVRMLHMIAERRPDADIYALAVHGDGDDDLHLHAHVAFGTRTTLRRDDLQHFREAAYALECELAPQWEDRGRASLFQEEERQVERSLAYGIEAHFHASNEASRTDEDLQRKDLYVAWE